MKDFVTASGKPVTIPVAGRLEVADYSRLVEQARANHLTLSQFVRKAVLNSLNSSTIEDANER